MIRFFAVITLWLFFCEGKNYLADLFIIWSYLSRWLGQILWDIEQSENNLTRYFLKKIIESVQTIKLLQFDIEIGHSLNDIWFLVRSMKIGHRLNNKGVIFDIELI